jgi:hypothetical protein
VHVKAFLHEECFGVSDFVFVDFVVVAIKQTGAGTLKQFG